MRDLLFLKKHTKRKTMPTLGTYVNDEIAAAITAAAKETDGKVAPWIADACQQRLEREGRLPGSPRAKAIAEVCDVIDALGVEEFRRRLTALVEATG